MNTDLVCMLVSDFSLMSQPAQNCVCVTGIDISGESTTIYIVTQIFNNISPFIYGSIHTIDGKNKDTQF